MWGKFFPNHTMQKQTEPVVTRVEITLKNSDGTYTTKRLTGTEAKLWHEYIVGVCQFCQIHSANPDWGKLKWKIFTTKPIV